MNFLFFKLWPNFLPWANGTKSLTTRTAFTFLGFDCCPNLGCGFCCLTIISKISVFFKTPPRQSEAVRKAESQIDSYKRLLKFTHFLPTFRCNNCKTSFSLCLIRSLLKVCTFHTAWSFGGRVFAVRKRPYFRRGKCFWASLRLAANQWSEIGCFMKWASQTYCFCWALYFFLLRKVSIRRSTEDKEAIQF